MDLNKLTKKELVEHAESLGVALSTTEEKWKKAEIISLLINAIRPQLNAFIIKSFFLSPSKASFY